MAEPGTLPGLATRVAELYTFRDHFFEAHSLAEARDKAEQLRKRRTALLEVFREEEAAAVEEDRAQFLYLKGRILNITGDYSPEAETVLSKAVKLRPDLVDAWNELGESYMMKQDWATARTCFEGALQHRKDKVVSALPHTHTGSPGELEEPVDDSAPGDGGEPGGADR
jgi:tetratricopeptide (TPR) repeat protein